jgi:predicted RNase H-like HicB family nuclease
MDSRMSFASSSGPVKAAAEVGDQKTVSPYQVSLSQKDGIWLLEAVGLLGVRSFGRTVSAAVVNMRQAIAESEEVDGSDVLELVFVIDDADVSVFLNRLREANRREKEASLARRRAVEDAIEALRMYGMSYRDIGSVTGLSHQRVAQIGSTGW